VQQVSRCETRVSDCLRAVHKHCSRLKEIACLTLACSQGCTWKEVGKQYTFATEFAWLQDSAWKVFRNLADRARVKCGQVTREECATSRFGIAAF
jgi:hypothetical protein